MNKAHLVLGLVSKGEDKCSYVLLDGVYVLLCFQSHIFMLLSVSYQRREVAARVTASMLHK